MALPLTALAVLACSSPTDPAWTFQGTYQLVSVDGHALPVTYATGGVAGSTLTYLSGLLAVESDSVVRVETTVSYGASTTTDHFESQFLYTRAGNRVNMQSVPSAQNQEAFFVELGDATVTHHASRINRIFVYRQ